MSIRIAIPILFVSVKMNLVRGRRWSVIEHALLSSLCSLDSNIGELGREAKLPTRLVVEAIIRLMRVGWVEMSETQMGVLLRASDRGRHVAKLDELPRVRHPFSRIGKFAVEKVSGQLFKARDLNIYSPTAVKEHQDKGSMVEICTSMAEQGEYHQGEAISLLLDEDEEYVSCDKLGPRESNRFAVVTVRGDHIEGIPTDASPQLKNAIHALAKGSSPAVEVLSSVERYNRSSLFEPPVNINLDKDSLVVGGAAHRNAILGALKEARSWFALHSTFINVDSFRFLAPYLKDASDRGVRVSLLWGQSETSPSRGQTIRAVQECQAMLQDPGGGAALSFQPFSTGSHAKMLLYDTDACPMVAIFGSCNWLSSSFDRVEVSLKLRDPRIVRLIALALSELARPMQGHWSPLSRDLAGFAVNLERSPVPHSGNAVARVIMGAAHNDLMLQARDNARRRIIIGSHRLSTNAKSLAVAPMLAAIRERKLSVVFRYSKIEPELGSASALFDSDEQRNVGSTLQFQELMNPVMHAKFLAWDQNDLVVTSQNLLSADPNCELFSEMGIHISGSNIAKRFETRFAEEYTSDLH